MALKYHPDKNPDDADAAAKFDEVKAAYDLLLEVTDRPRKGLFAQQLRSGYMLTVSGRLYFINAHNYPRALATCRASKMEAWKDSPCLRLENSLPQRPISHQTRQHKPLPRQARLMLIQAGTIRTLRTRTPSSLQLRSMLVWQICELNTHCFKIFDITYSTIPHGFGTITHAMQVCRWLSRRLGGWTWTES
eukprot:SAG31_NODE_2694_length_5235_cov_3.558995_3_plen_191_part_00